MISVTDANERITKKFISKKNIVLNTALSLFAQYGYCAVGVDRIKEEAGVAKMTMYKYFPTKEALIKDVLLQRDQSFRIKLTQAASTASTPLMKLKSVFDWHAAWFQRADFHGCMFIKASEEFADASSSIRVVCREHKLWISDLLMQLLIDCGAANAQALAKHLLIVLEGLTVNANMFGDSMQVAETWKYVSLLVDASIQVEKDA